MTGCRPETSSLFFFHGLPFSSFLCFCCCCVFWGVGVGVGGGGGGVGVRKETYSDRVEARD